MKIQKWMRAALVAGMVALSATPALADGDRWYYEQNKAQFISYEQAGAAALKAVGGGVIKEIEFEHKRALGDFFDVEVIAPNGLEYDVRIDAKTGRKIYVHLDH